MKKILFFFIISIQFNWAQVQFEASVSKNKLGINERIRIDFAMNADGDNFVPPNFEASGFQVVGGPFQQVSQQWINGRGSFQKTYSYILVPTRKGDLIIRGSQIEINGQIYRTAPIKVNVGAAVSAPPQQQRPRNYDPFDPFNEEEEEPQQQRPQAVANNSEIHLVAEISKTNPFLNEPITVIYKLYCGYNIGITNWRELDKPKYNDFWSQNIDIKELVAKEDVYNGKRVRSVILRKTVLYPQKSGKLTIAPLSLDIDVQLPGSRRDIFGNPELIDGSRKVSAGVKTINVKPLPENNKPDDFSGAVGNFTFKVVPSKTQLKNGEALDLSVIVAGKGNFKLFDLPKPVVPTSLEMYDPVREDKIQTPLSGMEGTLLDKYSIIPQYKGKYPIKPMRFSYFDLSTNTYKTITSPEIMIEVLDGPMAVASNSGNKKLAIPVEQFAFIKSKTKLISTEKNDFFGSGLFFTLLTLPFLCLPIIILSRKRKAAREGDISRNKTLLSNKLAKKYLSEARQQITNKEQFYIALEKALHNFLKAKLSIETSEMSKETISTLLKSKNADSETVASFIKLIENCEFARYAPSSSTAIEQDYEKAVTQLSELEKQIS
jgi:hypothetical protein